MAIIKEPKLTLALDIKLGRRRPKNRGKKRSNNRIYSFCSIAKNKIENKLVKNIKNQILSQFTKSLSSY